MKNHLYDIFEKWGTNIWIISDPHFSDLESWTLRFPYGCDDPIGPNCEHCQGSMNNCARSPLDEYKMKEFDDILVRRINRKVGKNGTLIILGDIGNIELVKKLKGYKVLIMGNHDKGASNCKRVSDDRYYITPEISSSSWSLLNENECHSKYLKYKNDKYNPFKHQYRDEITDEIHNVFSNELPGSYFLGEVVLRKRGNANFKNVSEIPNYILDKVRENLEFIKKDDRYTKNKTEEELIIEEANIIAEKIDNHLFDEVYEGPLMINDRVILSHEPIPVPEYMFNIHGHVHNEKAKGDEHHLNVICECVDYEPVSLSRLLKEGLTKNIDSIHRETIDKALLPKLKKDIGGSKEEVEKNIISHKIKTI